MRDLSGNGIIYLTLVVYGLVSMVVGVGLWELFGWAAEHLVINWR